MELQLIAIDTIVNKVKYVKNKINDIERYEEL